MRIDAGLYLFLLIPCAFPQTSPELKSILDRLDRLEQENRALREQVRELRERLEPAKASPETPDTEERLDIYDSRIEEQAQTKVEASQKFPIRLTGMALFNAFRSGRNSGGEDTPILASRSAGEVIAGGSFRQSIIGLEYHGPKTLLGGNVHGSLMMDFFDSALEPTYSPFRLRTANFSVDWKTRSISAGIEKPVFNPREPTSLAYVGILPLSGSGNLWHWEPQVRFEQRFSLSEMSSLRAQIGVFQTAEEYGTEDGNLDLEHHRPGLEGRFELAHRFDDSRRLEFAPGFHVSKSHVNGFSVPSNLFSLDWLITPLARVDFTGAFFTGKNVAHLGGLRQGFRIAPDGRAIPVHSQGGWAQLTIRAMERLSFNFMSGQEDTRNSDLLGFGVAKNLTGAANVMYRLAPNVLLSFEALQARTTHVGAGTRLNNRYDLAVAYLF